MFNSASVFPKEAQPMDVSSPPDFPAFSAKKQTPRPHDDDDRGDNHTKHDETPPLYHFQRIIMSSEGGSTSFSLDDENSPENTPVPVSPDAASQQASNKLGRRLRQEEEKDPVIVSCSDESGESNDSRDPRNIRSLFDKANEYLLPGPFFRYIVSLYAERKMLVFFFVHFMSTIIIWFHFGYMKFEQQKEAVPEGAPHYWLKRLVPPIEFGSMHAILFQMALIPFTMSRYTISTLSDTILSRFVPFNRTLGMHIHLGYTLVTIVFLATILFFAFFGFLCAQGEDAFCTKFRSEIMCTGYGILASLLIIAGTSYVRHKIPYELFYAIHHLVFIMYAITIAHTFDIQQRHNNTERSQTFKWFSAPLLYYICDRTAMHLNQKFRARLTSCSSILGSNGSRMILLKMRRPALFRFRVGQYAYLKLDLIDIHWHPFSIGSEPESPYLEFYVEVFDDKSWTGKLWNILNEEHEYEGLRLLDMEIMGPFGAGLAKLDDFSHVLALGTGTGIVPVLSLFKQHVRQLLRLAPETHCKELEVCQQQRLEVEMAEQKRKGSFAQRLLDKIFEPKQPYVPLQKNGQTRSDTVREAIRKSIAKVQETNSKDSGRRQIRISRRAMKQAAFRASRSIYGIVLLCFLPVFGISLIALTISWNTINRDLYDGMCEGLQTATIIFQLCFAAVSVFVWDANHLLAYTDLAAVILIPFVDWFWFGIYDKHGRLSAGDITLYCLYIGYMVFRTWAATVMSRHGSWSSRTDCGGVRALERLDVIWVTRSASLVSEILPDINEVWQTLVDSWGDKNASAVCRLSVYVTEKDPRACKMLKEELAGTPLYEKGWVHFGRPDFGRLIEDHTIELISTRRTSRTLMAYVGSRELANELHRLKISNDIVKAITGNKNHQMDFVAENYGGCKPKDRFGKDISDPYDDIAEQLEANVRSPLTTRRKRTTSF